MTDLLSTKLYIPPTRSQLVSRSRLIDKLNTSSTYKLTLVSAPAGFGKTTLLSDWTGQIDRPVAWLSLDESDNECDRLLSHVIAALQTVQPKVGESVLAALQAPQPPSYETLIAKLINELAASPEPLTLVIDDYHHITAPDIFQSMSRLLEYFPPNAHLIIATRADPPLPLSRLRAAGELSEIRTDDLRFTLEETTTFFNQVMGLALSTDHVTALDRRTEGWVTGLQLAALSMRHYSDAASFITGFSGRHHHILDYLTDEVLNQQSSQTRAFLLQTSILDRLCAPLCEAIVNETGIQNPGQDRPENGVGFSARSSGQEILEYLEQANLFIIPLDNERRWYRYHHLFAESLRHYLRQTAGAELIVELHRRAATWFEESGMLEAAVRHALAAPDPERAADIVENAIPQLSPRMEMFGTFFRLLRMLPEEVIRARPRICLEFGWALFLTGNYSAEIIGSYVQTAESLLKDNRPGPASQSHLSNILTVLKLVTAHMKGDYEQALALGRQALGQLSNQNLQWRSAASLAVGVAELAAGNIYAASRVLDEANSLCFAYGDSFKGLYVLSFQGRTQALQGQLHQAAKTYLQAIDLPNNSDGYPAMVTAATGLSYAGLGELQYEWNELEAAAQTVRTGFELGQQWEASSMPEVFTPGYTVLARIRYAQEDVEDAYELLRQAEQAARNVRTAYFLIHLEITRSRFWLVKDDLEAAIRWADAMTQAYQEKTTVAGPAQLPSELQIAVSRVRVAQYQQAQDRVALQTILAELARYQKTAEARGYCRGALDLLLLQALSYQYLGNTARAESLLLEALIRTESEGYIRLFVDEGPPMTQLLLRLVKRQQKEHRPISQISPDYISQILAALGVEANLTIEPNGHLTVDLSMSPLTEREIEVLHLVADGMSNSEIAQQLVISIGTIKRHLINIYKKLDVHSRVQAIARARELGLL